MDDSEYLIFNKSGSVVLNNPKNLVLNVHRYPSIQIPMSLVPDLKVGDDIRFEKVDDDTIVIRKLRV